MTVKHETQSQTKTGTKRIHSVTIKRMLDDSPDTSWLGEYSNKQASEFSIDRSHDLDCPFQDYNKPTVVLDQLERAIAYLNSQTYDGTLSDDLAESIQDAQNILIEAQEDLTECDCGESGDMERGQYQWFNPSRNYVDERGKANKEYAGDVGAAEIREYVRQDYARMESLNRGDWCFIGIKAQAEYSVGDNRAGVCQIQTLDSMGLWGIESDSEESYFDEVANEELAELRSQLAGIGFSKRAIAAAFKNVERNSDL